MFCCCHRDDVLGVVIQGHVGVLPNQDTLGPGNVSACNLGICTPSRVVLPMRGLCIFSVDDTYTSEQVAISLFQGELNLI